MNIAKYKKIEKAKKTLEENGYYVENLWCVDDVLDKYDCFTKEEAMSILNDALTNDATYEQIWLAIFIASENLKKEK
jgi:hypothetical protein